MGKRKEVREKGREGKGMGERKGKRERGREGRGMGERKGKRKGNGDGHCHRASLQGRQRLGSRHAATRTSERSALSFLQLERSHQIVQRR